MLNNKWIFEGQKRIFQFRIGAFGDGNTDKYSSLKHDMSCGRFLLVSGIKALTDCIAEGISLFLRKDYPQCTGNTVFHWSSDR